MKPPAFQFYADDFLAGVADMTQSEVGAYILLLAHQWSRGQVPADAERAALVAKGPVTPHVIAKFPDGKNARLERVRAEQNEFRNTKQEAGRMGAERRWHSHSTPIVLPLANGMANDSSPSPSPSPTPIDLVSPPPVFTPPERARGALQPVPDPNIMPAAPRRPVNPSQRKPVDVQECLAMASRIGWGEPEARRWHSDMEASGWAKVDGTPFGNWSREMCIARDRARETQARNGGGKPTTATATARHGPSLREVQTYAETKDDGSRRASGYAVSWWQAWEGRRWKNKEGHAIDWQIVFAKDVQNHLRAPLREG